MRSTEDHSSAPRSVSLEIRGERVELLAQRAVWWKRRKTLLVADLHIGKEETFRKSGIAMPHAVLEETLSRLGVVIAACAAERVVVIGDLIHAKQGLSPAVVEQFGRWRDSYAGRIELVIGNHDRHVRKLPESWGIELRGETEIDAPFCYRHEPSEGVARDTYEWSGHLHPTARVAGAALPAFVIGRSAAILPAFTSFSRGPGCVATIDTRVFAVAEGSVVELASQVTDAERERPSRVWR
jgi:uncharacterized protein